MRGSGVRGGVRAPSKTNAVTGSDSREPTDNCSRLRDQRVRGQTASPARMRATHDSEGADDRAPSADVGRWARGSGRRALALPAHPYDLDLDVLLVVVLVVVILVVIVRLVVIFVI